SKESAISAATDRTITFGRQRSIVIGPGAVVISDPVSDLEVPPLTDLAVSLYLPHDTGPPTKHMFRLHTAYVSDTGDFTRSAESKGGVTTTSSFWLSAIHVLAPTKVGVIAAFGDSITDGDQSTADTDSMWPAVLPARLVRDKRT